MFRRLIQVSKQELALVGVTILWGSTFSIIHEAMRFSGPLFFVGVRFLIAGILSGILFRRLLPGLTRQEFFCGILIGTTIFLAFSLQTLGLTTINSSTSAFLTSMYVPVVPFFQWLFLRQKPGLQIWIGAFMALTGLACIAGNDIFKLGLAEGELQTLGCALILAIEIILISYFSPNVNSARITFIQLMTTSVLSFLMMVFMHEPIPLLSLGWIIPGIGLGVASVVIQLTMNWAQTTVPPSKATIIYSGEPIWGGVFGYIAGEQISKASVVGAVLIIFGIILSEIKLKKTPLANKSLNCKQQYR